MRRLYYIITSSPTTSQVTRFDGQLNVSTWITAYKAPLRQVDKMTSLLASGGFQIRQWTSNYISIVSHLPTEARSENSGGQPALTPNFEDLVEATCRSQQRTTGQTGNPGAADYQKAETTLIQQSQRDSFPEETQACKSVKPFSLSSRLLTLSPEFDASSSAWVADYVTSMTSS